MTDPAADGGATGGLSELEVALLGLLSVNPMTGYEIRSHFDRALSLWWTTPRTQIYPKLRELEGHGLIASEHVVQTSRPNKRVYTITDRGLDELRRWLRGPVQWVDMKHHMMMRLFLGNLLPAAETRQLLEDYRDRTRRMVEDLREVHRKFAPSLDGPHRQSVFFELLSLEHLIAIAELEAEGTDRLLQTIDQDERSLETGSRPSSGRLLTLVRGSSG